MLSSSFSTHSKLPTKNPSKNPTSPPILPLSETTTTTEETVNRDGSFYCGLSVYEAGQCEKPCPNGIVDCPTGFCYAVTSCNTMAETTPNPTTANPTPNPTTANPTPNPTTANPTPNPTPLPTPYPTSTDFYCGASLIEASASCEHSCPTGSPSDCPDNLTCDASTGCSERSTTDPSPTAYDPSGAFYCGSSFLEASSQCLVPCPSGVSSDCPPNQACYANTPCGNKDGFYCGTSIVNASASCEFPCLSGLDSECPSGLSCYETQTCQTWGDATVISDPGTPTVEEGTKYCGYSFEDAATSCTQACPNGLSNECPEGMSCYSHTPCEDTSSFYCGLSWNNAASSCQTPCPSGTDADCPAGTHCYAYTHCEETDSFMCGTSFEDAASSCDKPCPTGSSTDCPTGMSCFTHTTCTAPVADEAVPPPSPPYIPGDSFFCGTSFLEASSQCTHPCPTRLDSECPDGEQCFGDTPCPTRETYYCGANLEEASAMCEYPCPTVSIRMKIVLSRNQSNMHTSHHTPSTSLATFFH